MNRRHFLSLSSLALLAACGPSPVDDPCFLHSAVCNEEISGTLTNADVGKTFSEVYARLTYEQATRIEERRGILEAMINGLDPTQFTNTTAYVVQESDVGKQINFFQTEVGEYGIVAGNGDTPTSLFNGYTAVNTSDYEFLIIKPDGSVYRSDEGLSWEQALTDNDQVIFYPRSGAVLAA